TGGSGGVAVADAALSAGMMTPLSPVEGQPLDSVVLMHFSDADRGGTVSDYTATVNWGDGTVEDSGSNPSTVWVAASSSGGFDVLGSHTYEEELSGATFSVSVTDHNAGTSGSGSLSVADAALSAGDLSVPDVVQWQAFSGVVFHFTDANPAAPVSDFTATVSWGDGIVQ